MSPNNSDSKGEDTNIELFDSPEFQEMKMRAEAAEARLRRIYNTPIWRLSKPIRKIYSKISKIIGIQQDSKFIFKPDPHEGQKVVDLIHGQIKFETRNADLHKKSIAIVAQFSKEPLLSKSLESFIYGLIDNSFSVVLVSACESSEELKVSDSLRSQITIVRKPNLGYDFGSWAVALNQIPEILNADELLLTNDSLIGPFADFSHLISKLKTSNYDITGITDSDQLQYHIQSYMVYLNEVAIKNKNIQEFLLSVVHLGLKNDVILKYELGLTRVAQLSGLFVGAVYPWNSVVPPGKNPTLKGWQRMIHLGFPFLKREAVRLASQSEVTKMIKIINQEFENTEPFIEEIKLIN